MAALGILLGVLSAVCGALSTTPMAGALRADVQEPFRFTGILTFVIDVRFCAQAGPIRERSLCPPVAALRPITVASGSRPLKRSGVP